MAFSLPSPSSFLEFPNKTGHVDIAYGRAEQWMSDLVPRVLRLFGQRLVARRDSVDLEKG